MLSPALPCSEIDRFSDVAQARGQVLAKSVRWISALVAISLVAMFAVALWARTALTPVEGIVALHSRMFAQGEGLYYDLNRYPFTATVYGPIYYSLCAVLDHLGLPFYAAARAISLSAVLGTLWFGWKILGRLTTNPVARTTGVLLAASTANFLYWGTVGQVDPLAIFFSITAFSYFLEWHDSRVSASFWLSGLFVVLAAFTKQTAIAAGIAIAVTLLWEDRKAAIRWIAAVALAGCTIVAALNFATHGNYLENAVFANLNPFRLDKLVQQAQYFSLTAGGLFLIVACGLRTVTRQTCPLFLYTGLALVVWLLTAAKVGSDLNYQVEMTLLLSLSAAVALDQCGFFTALTANRKTWLTLLQIPLLLHVVLNLTLTFRNVGERALFESVKAREIADLRPYMGAERKHVLGGGYDALMQLRGRIEVETIIYTLLVEAGRVDGSPLLRDLDAGLFDTVVLPMDLAAERVPDWVTAEVNPLPKAHLDVIRRRYRLVKHIDGAYLNGDYIYEPIRD